MPSTGQFAQNPDDIRDRIITQLKKLGGTIFECSNAEVQMPQIPFIQISAINQMRRQAVDELAAVRSANHPRIRVKRTKSDCPYISGSLDYHGNVLNKMARRFYERRGVKDIAPAMESGSFISGSRVMVTKHCLKFYLDLCPKEGKAAAHTELWLIDEDGRRYRLQFDCKQCRMEIYFGSGL